MEITITNGETVLWAILAITGFSSGVFAWVMPPKIGIFAGFIYFNLPISMNVTAFQLSRKVKKLQAKEDWNTEE